MKTSNKLFIAAILIIIASMVAFDFALRAEYLKGNYKSQFYGMQKLNFKDFNKIDNRVANRVNLKIMYGINFTIWANNNIKDYIKISKNGSELIIDSLSSQKSNPNHFYAEITIICPSLNKVVTSSKSVGNSYEDAATNLQGFNLQNLNLIINNSTHINLENSKIGNLQANVGSNLTQHAYLFIASNNQIENATIDVPGKNQLVIENPKINKSNFTISDSANVSLGGSILKQLARD